MKKESSSGILESIKATEGLEAFCLNDAQYPLPKPYCFNHKNVRAFVVGADPSNFSDAGSPVVLDTVFGIGSGDARYFNGYLCNLKQVGLNLENIYVQNLVRNYLSFETSKKPAVWRKFAELWIGALREEFRRIDPTMKIPALITAEAIYEFLLLEASEKHAAITFYECRVPIPIPKEKTKLGRPVVPLYRHPRYRLADNKWPQYVSALSGVLSV